MVRINKIYTRTGDDGATGLVDGSRVAKDSLRVEAFGTVDELNSVVGIALAYCSDLHSIIREKLIAIQHELFDLGSLLASPAGFDRSKLPAITEQHISRLEQWIDELNENLPPLTSFLLPGGSKLNGHLHLCRTVCRRAERRVISLVKTEPADNSWQIYLNRLSDLFFAMSRRESALSAVPEVLWKPGVSR
ncbi:MAG: cob(I)yrinic acid a,c-diamide adenosyltransferase [Deltaproteobacteria bacterium]|nr:cob(I)yrinic acid a,c-diamide adenosyltransferase [Deltaproteobacteria bacterium]